MRARTWRQLKAKSAFIQRCGSRCGGRPARAFVHGIPPARMVEETFEPGMAVSLVGRRHGVVPNRLFTWRRLVAQGGLTTAGSGEEVVPASEYPSLAEPGSRASP